MLRKIKRYILKKFLEFLLDDGVLVVKSVETKGNTVYTDEIKEKTSNAGVTVDGCLIKDGSVAKANDLNISGAVHGSILYFDGTNWVQLSPGTSGQYLKTQGEGNPPVWSD